MAAFKGVRIVRADAQAAEGECAGAEPFALLVLGDSMAPEFADGDVIVVEPDGLASDGAFVVAQIDDGWSLRQLVRCEAGWQLRTLDASCPPHAIDDLASIRGVVIQKSVPGRRSGAKRYVE